MPKGDYFKSNAHKAALAERNKNKTFSTEQYLTKLKESWADIPYDLSKVQYLGTAKKITLCCSVHGDFKKWPSDVLAQSGCPKCSNQGKSAEEHLREIIAKNPSYDFSQFVYKNARTKSIVVCSKHGQFLSEPMGLKRGIACPQCGIDKNTQKRIDSGLCRDPKDISDYEAYRLDVRRETERTYRANREMLGKRDWQNHLDHIYSILDGWNNNVDPAIMGSIVNLRMLPKLDNQKKNSTSHMTLDELYEKYKGLNK